MAENDALRRTELKMQLQFFQEQEHRLHEVLNTSNVPEIREQANADLKRTVEQIGSVVTELNELDEAR
jgi:uncharacterized coiled-coil DUF342 family protein